MKLVASLFQDPSKGLSQLELATVKPGYPDLELIILVWGPVLEIYRVAHKLKLPHWPMRRFHHVTLGLGIFAACLRAFGSLFGSCAW